MATDVVRMTVSPLSFPAQTRQAISTRDELYRGLSSLTNEACATQFSRMPSYVMSCSVLVTFFAQHQSSPNCGGLYLALSGREKEQRALNGAVPCCIISAMSCHVSRKHVTSMSCQW